MGRRNLAVLVAAFCFAVLPASLLAQVGPRRLSISTTNPAIPIGQTRNLTVSASFFRSPNARPFQGKIRWFSSDRSIATVDSGTVTASGVNRGSVTITAVSGPAAGSITLAVVPSTPLTGLSIIPRPPNPLPKGLPQQFQATASYGATLQDVTAITTWSSSDSTKAIINSSGRASTLGVGATTITGALGGSSDSTTLTVTPAVLQSIEVLPRNYSLPSYSSQQFTALGHWTDGTRPDINVSWSSTNTNVATVTMGGRVSGFVPGGSNITANDTGQGVSGQTTINVVITTGQAVRFLEQSSFGPTSASIGQLQSIGFDAYISQQFSAPISTYPPPVCNPDCGDLSPLQDRFFNNAMYGADQLRQRVAFALQQIFVISGNKVGDSIAHTAWQNMMLNDAFGTYDQLDRDVTLSPAMGNFLDMVNNDAQDPASGLSANENYARELIQLFNAGVYKLNLDGTLQLDAQNNPIPAYNQATIKAFAKVFTGWTYPTNCGSGLTADGHNYNECYIGQMFVPFPPPNDATHPADINHDKTVKTPLLNGVALPANQTSAQDLNQGLANIFGNPNVGPFVSKQLIKHLVKSNPSPAYVQRVAAVFNDNGSGVRGDLRAVVKAILLDPEARQGDVGPADPNEGHLREPVLLMTSALRGLDATQVVDNPQCPTCSDLPNYGSTMGQTVLYPPSVFNFYPIEYRVPDETLAGSTSPLIAPEFGLMNTTVAFIRANFINDAVYYGMQNTSIDLSPYQNVASSSPETMVEMLNQRFLHGQMSDGMRYTILNVVALYPSSDPFSRAEAGIYLVLTSSQYQVQH